jgi:hypothetical protein
MMMRVTGMFAMRSAGQCDTVDRADLGNRDAPHLRRTGGEHRNGCLEDERANGDPQGEA